MTKGTAKTDVLFGGSADDDPSPLFPDFVGGGLLNTETGAFGAVESLFFSSVWLRSSSPNDFCPPDAKAPNPPPLEKLLNPFALALLFPRLENADCPKLEEEAPKEDGAPNTDFVSGVLGLPAGLPKAEGAPKVGFTEGVGVPGVAGAVENAGGVLLPNALGLVFFGGLKNGELEGFEEPKAPKPDSSLPKPAGEVVMLPNALLVGGVFVGVALGVPADAVVEKGLGLPNADVDFPAVAEGVPKTEAFDVVDSAFFSSLGISNLFSLFSGVGSPGFASELAFTDEPKAVVPPCANAAKPPPEPKVDLGEDALPKGEEDWPNADCPKAGLAPKLDCPNADWPNAGVVGFDAPKLEFPKAGEEVEGVFVAEDEPSVDEEAPPKPKLDVVWPPNAPNPVAGFSTLPKAFAEPNAGVLVCAGVDAGPNAPNIPVVPVGLALSASPELVPPSDNPPKPVSVGVSVDIVSSTADVLEVDTAIGDANAGLAGVFVPSDDGCPNFDGPAEANALNAPVLGVAAKADAPDDEVPKAGCPKPP